MEIAVLVTFHLNSEIAVYVTQRGDVEVHLESFGCSLDGSFVTAGDDEVVDIDEDVAPMQWLSPFFR